MVDHVTIADLYAARGGETYGENVTQIAHATLCAALAAAGGAARRWDDSGKRDDADPLFAYYLPLLARLLDRRR